MFMACGTVWAQAKGRGKSCRWVVTSRLLCSKENHSWGMFRFLLSTSKENDGGPSLFCGQCFTWSFMKWLPGSSPGDVVKFKKFRACSLLSLGGYI